MKLKIVLLALIGAAGATSSFALADSGHHGRMHAERQEGSGVQESRASSERAAPQSFTVTVTHAGRHSAFKNGDVVTVSLGAQGQTVAVTGVGCADGSTLQAGTALLHVRMVRPPRTTTETTTPPRPPGIAARATASRPARRDDDDHDTTTTVGHDHRGHHDLRHDDLRHARPLTRRRRTARPRRRTACKTRAAPEG